MADQGTGDVRMDAPRARRATATIAAVVLLAVGFNTAATCADTVELTSGEVLQGAIMERSAESLTLAHPILGPLDIALSDLSRINGREVPIIPETRGNPVPAGSPPPKAPAPASEESDNDPPAPAVPEPESPWKSQIELGFNGSDGSSQDTSLRASFRTERNKDTETVRFDTTYRSATRRGDRTENRFTAGLYGEWREAESRWNIFSQGRFDADEFQAWDHRLTLNGGFGYELLRLRDTHADGSKTDAFILTTRGGGGIRREFGSMDTELNPEGVLGGEFDWFISDRQSLSGGTTLFPDLEDFSQFRLVSSLDWKIKINEMEGIDLKLGLSHEYESETPSTIPNNDITAYASLVIRF